MWTRRPVVADPRDDLTAYIRTKEFNANTMLAMRSVVSDIGNETALYKALKNVPADKTRNFRNDMYVVGEAIRLIQTSGKKQFAADDMKIINNYKKHIDLATKFIPLWVKVAVAMALGLGTMIGWKRIVVTVGEKIGKDHLTYGQGAAAEITAMLTIGGADYLGFPSVRRTCFRPALREPWPPIIPGCNGAPFAIWRWPGC